MKKMILFLYVTFIVGSNFGFAQNNEVLVPQFTKEEAIDVIKKNYLYMYFGYPEDTTANINRFINNINEVVSVNKKKREKIKMLVLSKIKQTDKPMSVKEILSSLSLYDWQDFFPVMGINANDIIKDCFNSSDYEKIYYNLSKDKIKTRFAYAYLRRLYYEEKYPGEVILKDNNVKETLDKVFNHYEII